MTVLGWIKKDNNRSKLTGLHWKHDHDATTRLFDDTVGHRHGESSRVSNESLKNDLTAMFLLSIALIPKSLIYGDQLTGVKDWIKRLLQTFGFPIPLS